MELGKRYNKGKLRYELMPTNPLRYLAEVYTKGAHKYSVYEDDKGNKILGKDIPLEEVSKYKLIEDASDNWRKGLPWMETLGAIQRHLEAFKEGEDLDPELKTRHLANAAWGLFTLMEFEKTHPELDDRPHKYLKPKRIGLDIDDVLAEWVEPFVKVAEVPRPQSWYFGFLEHVDRMVNSGFDYTEFMRNLPVKTKPEDIPFEPVCYITNRTHTDVSVAEEWLKKNGFAQVPVIQTAEKVKAAKEMKLDVFVDDKFETFVAMNNAGILCYLYDAPHNQRYNVGYRRIKSLKELV